MSYPINYPTPQGANVQIFYGSGISGASPKPTIYDWVKPQGASFVWFTLIGGGGSFQSGGPSWGASGAVTNFMCPAFLIPDMLTVSVGGSVGQDESPGGSTFVIYQQKNNTGYTLLTANAASGGSPGAASNPGAFGAMGFFQSIDGQTGSGGSALSPSATTFLSADLVNPVANYGYTSGGSSGYFQISPIIVGTAGTRGAIGCGGTTGGPGLAVIITW